MILKCQWCNKEFDAKRKDTKYCCEACSKRASRYRLSQGIDSSKHICAKCQKEFIIKEHAYNRRYCYDCMPKIPKSGAENRAIIKQWALEYKGKQCCICGYDKCSQALDFHHIDNNKKEFVLSDRNLILDWQEIKKELDKCLLVCSNCHREIHAGMHPELERRDNYEIPK